MTTIRLVFAAARYHATPWGRHVNEGVAEWPPSPYRLLRALYDVWQRKCFELPAAAVEAVLQSLAASPPISKLPRAVATHTRSYLSANSKDPTEEEPGVRSVSGVLAAACLLPVLARSQSFPGGWRGAADAASQPQLPWALRILGPSRPMGWSHKRPLRGGGGRLSACRIQSREGGVRCASGGIQRKDFLDGCYYLLHNRHAETAS